MLQPSLLTIVFIKKEYNTAYFRHLKYGCINIMVYGMQSVCFPKRPWCLYIQHGNSMVGRPTLPTVLWSF